VNCEKLSALALSVVLSLSLIHGQTYAATIHVPADQPTIQAGLDAASAGDSIIVAPGIFTGPDNTTLNFLGKDVVLKGAGPDSTIIDCQNNVSRVLRFENGESRAAVLRDLTLQNNEHYYEATGVNIHIASPSIINVHLVNFDGNSFYSQGGALRCASGSPLLQDVVVRDCHGRGGILMGGGAPELVRVLVENCHNGEYDAGGGIEFINCAATVSELTVRDCSAFEGGGGGVACAGSPSPTFEDCMFEGNVAFSEVGWAIGGGGMLCADGASPVLTRCTFTDNLSRDGGGGLAAIEGASPTLEEVLFERCSSDFGGTILLDGSSATLRRVTIVGSQFFEDWGIGPTVIHCLDSSLDIQESLVAFNNEGPGIWIDATSSATVACSDFFGNPDGNFAGDLPDQIGLNGNISVDPVFCDTLSGDYTLDGSSPCLPWSNDCGVQMGALGLGCGATPVSEAQPVGSILIFNQPNPFNPATELSFVLGEPAAVSLSIYDITGRHIATLLKDVHRGVGRHTVSWDGRAGNGQPLPSGVYFCEVEAGEYRATRKMTLLK